MRQKARPTTGFNGQGIPGRYTLSPLWLSLKAKAKIEGSKSRGNPGEGLPLSFALGADGPDQRILRDPRGTGKMVFTLTGGQIGRKPGGGIVPTYAIGPIDHRDLRSVRQMEVVQPAHHSWFHGVWSRHRLRVRWS
jgi:hypothetical protein